ncbi:MAG: ABC transporter ATP-binding protein [Bacilli bacterium]
MKKISIIKLLEKKTRNIFYINCVLSIISGISVPFSIVAISYFTDSINQANNMIIASIILVISYILPIVNLFINYNNKIINQKLDVEWNSFFSSLISKISYYEYENQDIFNKIKQIRDNNLYQKKISYVLYMNSTVVNILFFILILTRVSFILLISILIFLPLVGFLISKTTRKRYNAVYDTNSPRRKTLYKSLILRDYTFAKEVRINNSASYMLCDWESNQKNLDKKELKIKMKYGLFEKVVSNIEYLIIFLNLIILLLVFLNEHISLGVFIGLSINTFNMKFLSKYSQIINNKKSISLLTETCDSMNCIIEKECQEKDATITNINIEKIEFKNVYFKYPKTTNFILNDFSFSCHKHETIAIVGENGAGKTTLVKLLLGLYKPTSGQILLNDIDISNYSKKEIANIFGVAFQDYSKYSITIKENIMMSDKQFDNYNTEILKYLGIDEIASKYNTGFETILGKSFGYSKEISGGEWQKISISRAMVREKNIYIFDEPTAALDPLQEIEMFTKIKNKTNDKMTFFITHRLGFTNKVDKILVIKNNFLCEMGKFEELVNIKGEFYRLYESQKNLYTRSNDNDE